MVCEVVGEVVCDDVAEVVWLEVAVVVRLDVTVVVAVVVVVKLVVCELVTVEVGVDVGVVCSHPKNEDSWMNDSIASFNACAAASHSETSVTAIT